MEEMESKGKERSKNIDPVARGLSEYTNSQYFFSLLLPFVPIL